ncbi:MAG: nucleotidyltransferase domain-containing protein [Ignavibacteriaceae bacterium]|nr:nucleotidyltransferase domain-containing protein [Ignavibacteriaceae bacterium]
MRLKTLSDDFINKLAGFSAGSLPPQDFERLVKLFSSEIKKHYFTHSSESNLLRITNGMFDKFFFLSECLRYPHYVEMLVSIASNSNYLSDILVINPEFFYMMTDSSILESKMDQKSFSEEVEERISRYASLDAKTHALNSLKRREILRIGLKDIWDKTEVAETTAELSILANTLTENLFESCYKFILSKYKIKKVSNSYCIISLGKLGGGELNYSSDIDIIIFYDEEDQYGRRMMEDGRWKENIQKKYYSELLSETIQLFLEKCTSSEAGSLYRIDLRLRPDGKSSSVCRSLQEYLDYYESRGSDWERQMLIKAGYLGGSEKLYSQFIKYVNRFIYPAVHFASPIEQIKKLRKIIEREVEDSNIKLIPGGIRDIEFVVQALQLLNGGKNESVKTGNTQDALRRLSQSKLLTKNETKFLTAAYIFYRKIEHFLQLMNNAQTHTIPESGEIAEKLSHYLGFKSLNKFKESVKDCRKQVRAIYNSVVGQSKQAADTNKIFSEIKFANSQRASNDISFLREGKGLTVSRKFDKSALEAFGKMEEKVYEYLLNANDPDLCLSNFVRVIKQADFPSIWYNEFTDENFLKIFLQLCERSQFVIDLFAEDKILRESFLSRDFLNEISTDENKKIRLKNILFRLAVHLTIKLIEPATASKVLSKTVREKIKWLSEEFSKKKKWKNDYLIIVLGSTGTGTMTFASDVDLIFAVKNSGKHQTIQTDFQELLGILKKEFSPFSVDCRLRPEGASSQLVWDFDKYTEYLNNRARIWEMQSFLKASFVSGNEKLFSNLSKSFQNRISKLSLNEIIKGINDIRSKSISSFPAEMNLVDLKKNPGGLNDVEYVAHYLLLSTPESAFVFIGKAIPDILKELTMQTIHKKVLNELADNYIFIKNLEIFNQIAFSSSSSKLSGDEKKFEKLAPLMEFESGSVLKKKLNSVLQFNRESYSAIIQRK